MATTSPLEWLISSVPSGEGAGQMHVVPTRLEAKEVKELA